jgi:hypothetical protein
MASSTLTILLLLGVIAGVLDTFSNSGSAGGLKIFGSPDVFPSSGSSVAFPLASTACLGASADPVEGTFGASADPSLEPAGVGCPGPEVEDIPSASFGTVAVSMYQGRCVKTLIFLPFSATEMAEVAVSLFSLFSRGIDIIWIYKTNNVKDSIQPFLASSFEGQGHCIIFGPCVGPKQFVTSRLNTAQPLIIRLIKLTSASEGIF